MCTCAAAVYVRLRWMVMAAAEGGAGSALQEVQQNLAYDTNLIELARPRPLSKVL